VSYFICSVTACFSVNILDCLSMATFSKAKNLVELGEADESVLYIHRAWKYLHLAGYFPYFHRFVRWCNHGTSPVLLKRMIKRLSPLLDGRDRTNKKSALPPEHAFAVGIDNHINHDPTNSSLVSHKTHTTTHGCPRRQGIFVYRKRTS